MSASLKPRILVVDDDGTVREVLRTILELASYEVTTATDGAEALRLINDWQPKAVITDIVMPKEEGLRLIFEARKTHPELRIVAMSGARSGAYLPLAAMFGANAVLGKPFEPAALLAKLAAVLAGRA